MKAMVLKKTMPIEQKPLQMVDLPEPHPGHNEILVKVSVCGCCHTELDEIEARLPPPKLPIVLGHQVVGTVADAGKDVTKFKPGERLGITWLYSSCGKCDFCRTGNENLCSEAKWTGKDVNGGYAQYMIIGEDFAYPIPPQFSDSQAAPLLCAGVIGYRAVRLADITNGQTIGLFGFGASAHIVIQIISYKFPNSPVFVFTRSSEHQQLAEKLGASWAGTTADSPPAAIKRAIDFTPVGETVRDALRLLQPSGRLVINAIRKETPMPALDYAEYLWQEREIKSVANVTRADAEEFLPLADRIAIIPQVQQFPLDQANDVLLQLKQARIKAAAVLQIPH